MSDLRWSEEADAVVNEDGTIVYRVSHEVGYMITEYHRLRVLAEQRNILLAQRNTQIGVLQNRVAAMQDTINELNRRLAHEAVGG